MCTDWFILPLSVSLEFPRCQMQCLVLEETYLPTEVQWIKKPLWMLQQIESRAEEPPRWAQSEMLSKQKIYKQLLL